MFNPIKWFTEELARERAYSHHKADELLESMRADIKKDGDRQKFFAKAMYARHDSRIVAKLYSYDGKKTYGMTWDIDSDVLRLAELNEIPPEELRDRDKK